MKKFVSENFLLIILVVVVSIYAYWRIDSIFFEPNRIIQEVEVASKAERENIVSDWVTNSAHKILHKRPNTLIDLDSLQKANPYNGQIIYILTTKMDNVNIYDYGTEAEILAMKCERARAVKETVEAERRAKEIVARAEAQRDSLAEKVLERLNDKSCN